MSYSIDEHYLSALKNYYLKSNDKISKIVDFTSNQVSTILNGSEKIHCNGHEYTIIDSFGGTKPIIFNYDFFEAGSKYMNIGAGIILDSQVVSYLHNFVSEEGREPKNQIVNAATLKLLKKIAYYSNKGWDFNAFFYLAEALGKDVLNKAFPHARAFSTTMLKLQTMDDSTFLEQGKIVPDPEKIDEYVLRNSEISFEDAAEKMINSFPVGDMTEELSMRLKVSYAALIKIGLLQHEKCDAETKFEKLSRFFHEELGIYPAREAVVGCLHFAGKAKKFTSIEKGAKNIGQKLLGSAWDLLLLRLPESIIQNEAPDPTSVYYVCTADKTLAFLGGMFIIRRVSSLKSGNGHIPSAVDIRYDLLNTEVGDQLTNKFVNSYIEIMRKSESRVPVSLEKISAIVSSLEQEMQSFVNV